MKLPPPRRPSHPDAILKVGPGQNDWLSIGQCESNILITGAVGSAKTTGPAANLALGLYAHRSRPAALVLCQKPDEAQRHIEYARMCGRLEDIVHVRPGGEHGIDIIDYELASGGVEQVKALIGVLLEVANRNKARSSSDSYWQDSSEKQMGNTCTIVQRSGLSCGLREIHHFCTSLPSSIEQLKDPLWRQSSYAVNCLLAATHEPERDWAFEAAGDWLLKEWPELSEKTRSIIQSVTLNTLDKLLSSKFADLITNDTTFTPEQAMRDGKIVIFDVPGAVHGPAAIWAAVALKVLFQRAAMRRDLNGPCRPLIFFTDEAANFAVPDVDAMFLSQSRQFKCICVSIVQNIPLVITALGSSESARIQALAWMSNHATVITAANLCPETNRHTSSLCGEHKETLYGGSSGSGQQFDLYAHLMGNAQSHVHANWSEQYRPIVPPERWMELLRGGKQTGFKSEAYTIQSGRLFSNGRHWIKGTYQQQW